MAVFRLSRLHVYVALVSGVGAALLAWSLLGSDGHFRQLTDPLFWILAGLVVLGEFRALVLPWHRNAQRLILSTTFAFALLLHAGPVAAAIVMGGASLLEDAVVTRRVDRMFFNAGQYIVTVMSSGFVLAALGYTWDVTPSLDTAAALWPLVPAGAVWLLLNHVLVATAVGLHQRSSIWSLITEDFALQVFTGGVLLAMAPPVLVVAQQSQWLVPLLLVPVFAVHRGAKASVQKEHDALHDALTGLPNRNLFVQDVQTAISEVAPEACVAVVLIDLDRFKEVNDTLGHQAGDALLREVGPRLQELVGEDGTAARLGGDEFGVVLPTAASPSEALATTQTILTGLRGPFSVEGLSLEIPASIGIAVFPEHGRDVSTLMQRADVAMYVAKDNHGGVQLYTPESDRHSRRRLALISDLRQAIAEDQLFLQYQPKADLQTGEVVGAEALVRWRHPRHGAVRPDEFIPLAERTGLIVPLTDHVLDHALKQCALWQRAGFGLTVAVNLSMQNLYDERLPATVAELLERHNLDAGWLELEITESSIMAFPEKATRALAELGSMGIRLAIDDFGTGYSSLGHLKQLPVDEVKIDKSFVQHMAQEDDDAVIVRSTIELARNLGIGVTAEGVETAEAWNLLSRLGCDRIQGYYLSPPLNAPELTVWLFEHRRERDQLVTYANSREIRTASLPTAGEAAVENVWC